MGTRQQPLTDEELQAVEEAINAHERVEVAADGKTKTVILLEPVDYAKEKLTEVTFRKPRGRDWRELDKHPGDITQGFALAASLSDKPMRVFDDMLGEDALLCVQVAASMGKKP